MRKTGAMNKRTKDFSKWIASEIQRTGLSKGGLAKALGVDPSAVTRILVGDRKLAAHEVDLAREYFGQSADAGFAILSGIPEIDVRAGAGGGGLSVEAFAPDGNGGMMAEDGIREHWGIPARFVRDELRTTPTAVRIVEVLGDSMEPTLKPGDRILIDLNHRAPAPPGIYAVWDGFGVVVKRIELIPRSDPPMVRLISDNSHHKVYEVSLADAHIIGRVLCRISAM